MTDEELKAIEARATAATEGEWRARRSAGHFAITSGLPGDLLVVAQCDNGDDEAAAESDATFIAAARTDVPALVTEVRRLKDARDLMTVEAGVYLAAVSTVLNDGAIEVEDLERKMDPDAFEILREGLRQLR